MNTRNRAISTVSCGLFVASIFATHFFATPPLAASSRRSTPVACTLLTAADATTALEVPSQPGRVLVDSTTCVWSGDPAASDSSRRVTLVTHSLRAFGYAMHPAITTIKIEPISGIGDEAFYQVYPNDQSPFVWVRKGDTVFDIRILTRMKPRPFTTDQEKSKEAVLAKAAVLRL